MIRLVLSLILTLFATTSMAAELRQYGPNVRALGMGGVRVFSANDAAGFLSNPAHLTYVKGFNWEVFNLGVGLNGLQTYEKFKDVKLDDMSTLSDLYGKRLWLGGEGHSAFAIPFFGAAVYDNVFADMMFNNPAFPVLDVTYINDYAFVMGGSVPLGPLGSFGLNVKRITRLGGPKQIGVSTLNGGGLTSDTILDQFQNEGVGYGLDAGVMYQLPLPFSPSFSLAWQDLGSTAFTKSKGADAPDRQQDNLTFATTIQSDIPLLGFAAGFEYRHINLANEQLGKKLHAGVELSLLNLDVRAGFSQGYYTYGAGVDLFIFQVDAALYTAETGAYPGQTPDQRIQVGISTSLGFDPDFNLTDAGGKRRRLKQRR